MKDIIFTNFLEVDEVYFPIPASKVIPDWYKETDSYMGLKKQPDGQGSTSATIKRCMPVFDAINSGYILVTHTDIWVSQKEEEISDGSVEKNTLYEWPSMNPIEFHPKNQAPLYPKQVGRFIPKWMNPWGIKTPPGYSTLFISPIHRNNPFVAFEAIVDTDKYTAPVNIVFTLSDPEFEGLVPAGTPIVQVIPFKRENWKMSIGTKKDMKDIDLVVKKLRSKFFDSYKNQFRQNKEYK
jgi:hypothetical protein